jgi:acetyl-CoA carboxylase carboxyl transferase subunit alpha
MSRLKVPVICIIIGEGASGGALGIGIGDRVLMLQNSWYSVISPENCSTILWRTWDFKERAAEALKLTGDDMLSQGLVDGVIPEPIGGAHTNWDETFETTKKVILEQLAELKKLSPNDRKEKRIEKFCKMGVVIE